MSAKKCKFQVGDLLVRREFDPSSRGHRSNASTRDYNFRTLKVGHSYLLRGKEILLVVASFKRSFSVKNDMLLMTNEGKFIVYVHCDQAHDQFVLSNKLLKRS